MCIRDRLIRAAVTVAEELSFSRAALKLHVSQPALTKQIQDLEATLRVPLFIRDRQRVHMTDAGRAFVEESKLALIHQELSLIHIYEPEELTAAARRYLREKFLRVKIGVCGALSLIHI